MRGRAGFTLVELVVVLAIMGILGSLALLSAAPLPRANGPEDALRAVRADAVRTGHAARLGQPHDLRAIQALPDGRKLSDSGDIATANEK